MSKLMEAKWSQAERDAYLKSHPQNFAGPDGSFPIKDASDVADAWDLAGHAADPAAVRAKIKSIAKHLGLASALPDTAKEETTESVRPAKKIGTLPICWLEYNARSLNGRIYPKATCDAIFRSAQAVLSDPNAMPPTTFVSHEAANGNVNTDLVGAPVKVWQEGSKFWANIDIADTSVARDILGLVEGGYLKSGSMRVAGVELMHDRNYDLPLVVVQEGVTPQFLGIDLTTRPGLADIARITQVVYESNGQEPYNDAFLFESREEPPAMLESSSKEAHLRVHDHLANVLDKTLGECHGGESAQVQASFTEAMAKAHTKTLVAAHDEAAKQVGLKCEGCYAPFLDISPDATGDFDNDGDNPAAGFDPDNDGESQTTTPPAMQEGEHIMTPEEMLAELAKQGYKIEAPKTAEQKRIEEQEAKLAELERKFLQLAESAPTQRQTLSNSSQIEESSFKPEQMYQEGDYLRGDLAPKNWRALANPAVPWPKDLHPKTALKELAPFLTHRLLQEEATASGRSLEIEIGLNGNL